MVHSGEFLNFMVMISQSCRKSLIENECEQWKCWRSQVHKQGVDTLIYKVIYHFVYFSFDYVQPFGYLCSILFLYMIFCVRYDFVPYQYSQ